MEGNLREASHTQMLLWHVTSPFWAAHRSKAGAQLCDFVQEDPAKVVLPKVDSIDADSGRCFSSNLVEFTFDLDYFGLQYFVAPSVTL